jgi:hypothetical protein
MSDAVNHPEHYTSHPSGVECIQITEHMPFCLGSAIKYLWRAGHKGDAVEDLKKAAWYVAREIARLGGEQRADAPAPLPAEAERRCIVAWLRGERETARCHGNAGSAQLAQWADCLDYLIDAIERGDHRKEHR